MHLSPSGTLLETLANPEIWMRWSVARGQVAELGLEARAFLPIEAGTRFGVMFAAPLRLRLGAVRVDTVRRRVCATSAFCSEASR